MDYIPLKALIVDTDEPAAIALRQALDNIGDILSVYIHNNIEDARRALNKLDINVIYIDPFSLGIENASNFIFQTRRQHPSVVFVLYYEPNLLRKEEIFFMRGNAKDSVIISLSKSQCRDQVSIGAFMTRS